MTNAAISAFLVAVIGNDDFADFAKKYQKRQYAKNDLVGQFAETEHDPEQKLQNANSNPHSITWAVFCFVLSFVQFY